MPTVFYSLFSTGNKHTVAHMQKAVSAADVYSKPSYLPGWRSKVTTASKATTAMKRPACLTRPTLLWIDDYKPGLELYRAVFENLGFKVFTASSGEQGLKVAALASVDVVVTDYEMPGMNGEDVARAMRALDPKIPVVLFSGSTLVPPRVRRIVDAVCDKAGSGDQLSWTIHRVLRKKPSRTLQPPPMTRASDVSRRTVA
jgi:CheY-like chemotaxis protein